MVTGTVDINTAGEYVLSYDVTDGYQGAETQTRRVLVGDLIAFLDQPDGARMTPRRRPTPWAQPTWAVSSSAATSGSAT